MKNLAAEATPLKLVSQAESVSYPSTRDLH